MKDNFAVSLKSCRIMRLLSNQWGITTVLKVSTVESESFRIEVIKKCNLSCISNCSLFQWLTLTVMHNWFPIYERRRLIREWAIQRHLNSLLLASRGALQKRWRQPRPLTGGKKKHRSTTRSTGEISFHIISGNVASTFLKGEKGASQGTLNCNLLNWFRKETSQLK